MERFDVLGSGYSNGTEILCHVVICVVCVTAYFLKFYVMEPQSNQFVITLPSDSLAENRPHAFRTHLPFTLSLRDDWEVALYSLLYPRTWANVPSHNGITVFTAGNAAPRIVHLPAMHYDTVSSLVGSIVVAIGHRGVTARFNSDERRVYFKLAEGISLLFDDALSSLLGVDPKLTISGAYRGSAVFPFILELSAIYVYCSIVSPQITGNTESPLLQLVPVQGNFGENLLYSPTKPIYLPIRTSNVSQVDINLADSGGQPIRFLSGHSVVQLHFRKRFE
jgi:hypothetical protein